MTKLSESTLVWLRCKEVFGGHKISRRLLRRNGTQSETTPGAEHQPFGPKRDPHTSGEVIAQLFTQFNWATPLAQAQLLDGWPQLVGERICAHTKPLYVDDGLLLVQCDSTAWATQLRAIRSELIQRIQREVPDAELRDIRFLNPGAPSWRHGNRSVPGLGPRDTYG